MSQRRLLPILGPITAVIKNKSQNPGHQRSDLVHAKSADVVQFENVTASSDFPSQKSETFHDQQAEPHFTDVGIMTNDPIGTECNASFSDQIQQADSKNSSNKDLISTNQLTNLKPEKSTQTKFPKYIPFDLNKETESLKIRSKLNDFHQNIEQMFKILLANQSSEANQMPEAKLSHLELNLNQMKKEILVLLYTNPQYKINYLSLNFKYQKLIQFKDEASKSKDSGLNSCDCDMFTRPNRLRNVFTRCSDVVTNSVLLTYAEVDKNLEKIEIEKARQEKEIESLKAQERPLLEILEKRKLENYEQKAILSEKELTEKSREYVQAALHKDSIDIMARWWRNFIKTERQELNDQRQKLDTVHVGSFQRMFHRIENVQLDLDSEPKLQGPLNNKYDNIELRANVEDFGEKCSLKDIEWIMKIQKKVALNQLLLHLRLIKDSVHDIKCINFLKESISNSPLYDDEIVKSIASTISRTTTCATETELRKTKNEIIEQAKKAQFRTSETSLTGSSFWLNELKNCIPVFTSQTHNYTVLNNYETVLANENSSLEDIAKIFAQLDGQSRLIVEPWRKEAELLLESRQALDLLIKTVQARIMSE